MNKFFLFSIILSVTVFSCKNKGGGSKSLPENVLENDLKFDYFSSKAKVSYLDSEQNLSTAVHIKIQQDSAIWMSITPALGIEMMRVLIRKDSVFMMNRLKKEYFAKDFNYLRSYFGMKINYKMVEKMMVGNIPLKNTKNQKSTKTDQHYMLEQLFSSFIINNTISRENKRMSNFSIKGTKDDFFTNVTYSGFELIEEIDFAKSVNIINTQGSKKTTVDIKYIKPKISKDPIKLSFKIPSSYAPIKM